MDKGHHRGINRFFRFVESRELKSSISIHDSILRILVGVLFSSLLFLSAIPAFAVANPPTILTPNLFSSQNNTAHIDGETGSLIEEIPIDIPPGRDGIQPTLTLDYNSQDTDQDSEVGYGWSLSIPYIERLNKTGSENLYGSNAYFTSSIDGELATYSNSTSSPTIDALIVGAGGGGGGASNISGSGGGGGGGGLATTTYSVISGDSYTVTIGSGGTGGASSDGNGGTGQSSSAFGSTATGGSGGGGGSAGSGGSSANGNSGGSGNSFFGNGGGGGGLGAVGSNAGGGGGGGAGGTGIQDATSGTSTYYGGGGGGAAVAGPAGSGGQGGGGAGGGSGAGHTGTANTGGGGGGGSSGNAGGAGGSGVVIISAPIGNFDTSLTTGGTHTTANGDDIWTFTSSGTFTPILLNAGQTTYAPRVDEGSFDIYTYSASSSSWTMFDKKGDEYIFGASTQSQQYSTSSPDNVFKWMLEKEIDPNGNYVRYVYSKDNNQIYPFEIIYTGHGSTDGPMTLTFSTTTRPDDVINLLPGFEVDTDYLISQITMAVSSTTVRQYDLSYTTGNNGYRSVLSSVQENGWNSGGTETSLPPWTFGYVSSSTSFVQAVPSNGALAGATNGGETNEVIGAQNGINEALNIYCDNGSEAGLVYPAGTGGGNTLSTPQVNGLCWSNSSASFYIPNETGTRFVDINGSGQPDIVQGVHSFNTGLDTDSFYLGNDNYASTTTWDGVIPPFFESSTGSVTGSTGIFGNVTGTGLPDYVANLSSGVSGTYLANGFGWTATSTIFTAPKTFPDSGSSDCTNSQLIDVNGDGLDDWVYTDGTNTYVLLNTGTGWESTPDSRWTIGTSTVYSSSGNCYDRGMRFVDINGDGLPDLVRSYTMSSGGFSPELGTYQFVYLNTGHGWATSTAYSTLPYVINGSSSGTTFSGLANFMGNGQQGQDVISTVTYPKGGSTSVTYGYTTQSGDNPQLPYNLLVVTKLVNHDGLGSNEETDYSYSGGLQYLPSNTFDRKFAGFASTTASTSQAITVTYYDQGTLVQTDLGEQSDGYAQINHPYRIDTFTPGGTLVSKTLNRWDTVAHGNSTFVGLGEQTIENFSSDGSHVDQVTDYTYSTSTDDLLQTTEYGDLGKDDGRVTFYTYDARSSINLSALAEKKVIPFSDFTLSSTTVSALVVGGGGSGGGNGSFGCGGGGGGGGGVLSTSTLSIEPGSYAITVGGSDQSSSIASLLTANAGGAGGGCGVGSSGGSGGGGSSAQSGGSGTASQGNSGGSGAGGDSGSGGGGASSGGAAGVSFGDGGAGGAGYTSSISGASVTYGGGGGGGEDGRSCCNSGGAGGSGGGGIGQSHSAGPDNGVGGTGGGGGGAIGGSGTGAPGGSGGSGVVIISAPQGTLIASGGIHSVAAGDDIWTFDSSSTWSVYGIGNPNSASSTFLLDTRYLYDNLPFGDVSVGNQTEEEDLISTSTLTYASSTKAYNSYGLVASSTDRDGNVTAYSYDSFDLYPATTTNALSQSTTYAYNYSNGQVATSTNPNGLVTVTLYDGVGRTTEVEESDASTPSTLDVKTTYAYTDSTSTPSLIHESDHLNYATTTETYDYYDGLNRLIQGRKSTENSGIFSVSDNVYDSAGSLKATSLPYFSSGSSNTSATTTGALFTYYVYNPLGRVETTANAVGTTTSAYNGLTKTTTDPNGNVADYISDAFGNLAQVVEHLTSSNATTTYAYDAANNLTNITDAAGNARNFTYDGLGDELTAQDLHNASDTTFGSWSYSYDPQGNLTSYTDPDGHTITHTYDALNRMLTESLTGSGTQITDTYDSCTNGIGELCTASSTAAKDTFAYDVLGRTTGATTTISGTDYGLAYGYDRQGNITSLTNNSDGAQVNYTYNSAGLISGVTRSGSSVASLSDFAPTNQLGEVVFGSGATTTYSYNSAALYRLTRIYTVSTPIGTTTQLALEDLNYTYDADGNILTRTDNSSTGGGQVVTYTYDDLNRITSASTTVSNVGSYDQAFTYDALGNILTSSDGIYSYQGNTGSSYADPDAVTQTVLSVGGSAPTIAYDNSVISGNGTPLSSLTFSYTTGASTTNDLMVVAVQEAPPSGSCSTDQITGVTYNGVGLTDAGYYVGNTSPVNGALKTYYGFAPATSTHNVAISANAACIVYATATTYSGVKQSGFPDASGTGNPLNDSGAVTTFQATTTTANNNAWAILIGVPSGSGIATAGSNTTIRQQQAGNLYYADSNGPISPAGSTGLNWTMGTSTHWVANYFSITPVVSNPGVTSTTTYGYDDNGNLLWAIAGATTTNYAYDYLNHLVGERTTGDSATSTYAYDAFGNRVSQTTGSTTTMYPNKYFSKITTSGATSTGTSTDYVLLPGQAGQSDRLLATVDQPLVNGAPSGSSTVRYVHPDNLGSTAVTSDTNGNLAESFDYAPYGSVLASTNTGTTTATRQFIGQFADASGLDYFQNRYYAPNQGQFLSQDPVFLALGNSGEVQQISRHDQQTVLSDPQRLNAYSYAEDNPITNEDPLGKYLEVSGSVVVPFRALSAGLRIDQNGIDFFGGLGVGAGLSGGVEIAWAPGQSLSHESEGSINVNAETADVFGGRISQNIATYSPENKRLIENGGPSFALVLGAGDSASVEEEFSGPVPYLVWGQPSVSNTQLYTGPTYLSQANITPTQTNFNSGRSTSGGGGSIGQLLSSLSNVLSELSTAIASYSNKSSH